jgi:hypothetical protein
MDSASRLTARTRAVVAGEDVAVVTPQSNYAT